LHAKIMGLTLELEDEPLTISDCYKLQPERLALLGELAGGLTLENAVAVTATYEGEVMETLLNSETMEQVIFEDPIMFSEASIAQLCEAQFEEDGQWVLSRGALLSVEGEKARLFQLYEETVTKDQPDCLSTLRRMLQAGPITRLYTGGGNKFIPSHCGFSLRMPTQDLEKWQMINDKGEQVDIPREAHAVRVWNATTRSYDEVDGRLNGAPASGAAADAWFVKVVKKLKGSPYIGSELLNALVTSVSTASMEALEKGDFPNGFEGNFSSRWTDLVVNN